MAAQVSHAFWRRCNVCVSVESTSSINKQYRLINNQLSQSCMTERSCTEATTPVHSGCQFVLFVPQLSQEPWGSGAGRGGTLRRRSYGYIKCLGYLGYGIDFLFVCRQLGIQCLSPCPSTSHPPIPPSLSLAIARTLKWSYHYLPFSYHQFNFLIFFSYLYIVFCLSHTGPVPKVNTTYSL